MSGWWALDAELDRWQASGRRATLWLRDDDACRDSAALRRLVDIGDRHAVPVVVAAIPAKLEASLVGALVPSPQVDIVQHGYAHHNHAAAGERSCELGVHRGLQRTLDELAAGRAALADTFGDRFIRALVPPWNRIDASVVQALPGAGLHGLSTFGPRDAREPLAGLVQCNSHVDLIAWRHGRSYIGDDRALSRIVEHLAARRDGRVDRGEPTGILTHHLDMSDAAWSFVDQLIARTKGAAQWVGARALFDDAPVTSARSA
jgi:peptidoglycan/xylan/chitin deacetylase (PgdA/CDA1 family)